VNIYVAGNRKQLQKTASKKLHNLQTQTYGSLSTIGVTGSEGPDTEPVWKRWEMHT